MATATSVKPYREVVGDKLIVNFHPGQTRAWLSTARELLILAGTQSGKTVFSIDWLRREIEQCGDGDYLYVTATYPLLQLKVLPEFLYVFRDILRLGVYKETDKVFEFHGGKTRVIFGTATNPESLESATAKAAVLDEAGQKQFRRDSREAVLRRLSIHQGRILYATTPYGLGWLKAEVYDRAKQPGSGIEVINFSSLMNPAFPRAEYERAKATMPRWKFRMFYDGLFEKPVGLVYDAFSEASCVIPRFPIADGWLWHVGHDFGGNNPAAVFYAQDPDTGQFYLTHTYKPGKPMPVAEQVAHFKDLLKGKTVVKRVGGSHQEIGWRDDYGAHGWPVTEPKINDVNQGIARVYAMHKLNKIMVFNDLHDYLDEKQSYSYKLNDRYDAMEEIEEKSSYHLMDCLAAGTMIETVAGKRPIETIKVGDMVATRRGYHLVTDAFQQNALTIRASFSDGTVLRGTPGHHVFVNGKGFVRLDALRYGDIMETWKENVLCSTASSIISTRNPSGAPIGFISAARGSVSIEQFGKMLMAQFPRAMSFITRTMTPWTIAWKIWNLWPLPSMAFTIIRAGSMILHTSLRYVPSPLPGTAHPKVERGIESTGQRHGGIGPWLQKCARSAGTVIEQLSHPIALSAQMPVRLLLAMPVGGIMKSESAQFVEAGSPSTNMRELQPVLGDVVRCSSVTEGEAETVYDLSVADVHEYYANSILVHNSERYILSDFTPETANTGRSSIVSLRPGFAGRR